MSKNLVVQEIRSLMEVIKEQQELVLSHDSRIPQIELDILMGNIRKLYENLIHLNRMNTVVMPAQPPNDLIATAGAEQEPSREVKIAAVKVNPETVEVKPETNTAHRATETLVNEIETPVSAPLTEIEKEEVLPQASLSAERTRKYTSPSAKAPLTASLFDDQVTVAEKFKGSPSLYDKIAGTKEDKSLALKLQQNPLSDLRKSIGINEKFSFVNELFDGDLNAYNDAIEKLNGSASHEAAVTMLENDYVSVLGWSRDGESFVKLKNLIDRRFSA